MNCMKCGVEIKGSQVFCESCLSEMQRYPVKPDIRVQLPVRPAAEGKPASKKEALTPEKQLLRLRRQNKRLFVALLCSVLTLALAVVLLFHMSNPEDPADNNIGKNYSTAGADSRP